MDFLNYHHLRYFWMVAREGGLVPASKLLRLSHPTLSAQIRTLEKSLGVKLFAKQGRRLVLTETGQIAFKYAEEIFGLGNELTQTLRGETSKSALLLRIGVAESLPKLIIRRLIAPVLELPERVRLICSEDRFDNLLASLALHALDVVLADAPLPPGSGFRGYSHLLGQCGVSFFARKDLAPRYRSNFPLSLNDAPMLLPMEGHTLRRQLDHWMERSKLKPLIVAEFEDSALLKVFGADGLGIFPAPQAVEKEVMSQYGVGKIGTVQGVREKFYAITAERRIKHPAVLALSDVARDEAF